MALTFGQSALSGAVRPSQADVRPVVPGIRPNSAVLVQEPFPVPRPGVTEVEMARLSSATSTRSEPSRLPVNTR